MSKTYTLRNGVLAAPQQPKAQQYRAPAQPQASAVAQQYAVVNARFALALQGSAHFANGNGKLYAVLNTSAAAQAYINTHKLQLVASVIPW
jgi:hypothetical protein